MSVELETELAARLLEYMISQHGKRDGGRAEVLTRDLGAAIRATDADTIAAAKPDSHLGLLIRLLGAVQVQSGRSFAAVPTVDGVDAACSAMRELVPALGATVQAGPTPAQLREAVRVQPLTARVLMVVHHKAPRRQPDKGGEPQPSITSEVVRTVNDHILPALPPEGSRLALEDGAWGNVTGHSFEGNALTVIVECRNRGQTVPAAKA